MTLYFRSDQLLSRVQLFATPWIAARQASLSSTNSRSSLRLTSIESVMPSSHLILCRPLLLLTPVPPSNRVFYNESTLHMRWPKYWTFSFSIIPSKEIPGLISFRMDWLDLFAVQGTSRSLLQHHSSKAINSSVLSLLHSPTLTSIHDHRKNHSLNSILGHYQMVSTEIRLCSLQPKMDKLYTISKSKTWSRLWLTSWVLWQNSGLNWRK